MKVSSGMEIKLYTFQVSALNQVVSFTLRPLYPKTVLVSRRLGEPQSQFGYGSKEKIIPPAENRTLVD
jgi:hypothetical protein